MTKQEIITEIQRIITSCGSFNIEQLDVQPSYPIIGELGTIHSLADSFDTNIATVTTYNDNGDEVDHYDVAYTDLKKSILKEILDVVLEWEIQSLETTD